MTTTYVYVLSGAARLECGPEGRDIVEGTAGDWAFVPKGLVHRESNPADEESVVLVFRLGEGTPVLDVDGPSPA